MEDVGMRWWRSWGDEPGTVALLLAILIALVALGL